MAAQELRILTRDRLQQELLGTPSFSPQRGMTTGSWEKLTWTCAAIHILPLQTASISSACAVTPGQGRDGHNPVHPQGSTNTPIPFTPPLPSNIHALLSRSKVWHIPASILLFLLLTQGAAGLRTHPQRPGASQPHFRPARGLAPRSFKSLTAAVNCDHT